MTEAISKQKKTESGAAKGGRSAGVHLFRLFFPVHCGLFCEVGAEW